jgi:HSP20 family protein
VNLNPTNEFRAMEEVFESLFGAPNRHAPVASSLPVDITENGGSLFVKAAVPGVEPNELNVSIEKNVLTIRGETRHESAGENEKVYRREVGYGAFARSIRLPEGLDLNGVDAEFKNGVVTISIPRLPEEQPKSIKINVRATEPTLAEPSNQEETN